MNLSLPAKKENLQKGLLHFPQHPWLRDDVGSGEDSLAPGIRYAITQLEKHLRILFNSGPRSWRRLVTGAQHADLVALRLMTLYDSWLLGVKKFNSFPAFLLHCVCICIYACTNVCTLWQSACGGQRTICTSSGDQTEVTRLGGMCPYPLNHFALFFTFVA